MAGFRARFRVAGVAGPAAICAVPVQMWQSGRFQFRTECEAAMRSVSGGGVAVRVPVCAGVDKTKRFAIVMPFFHKQVWRPPSPKIRSNVSPHFIHHIMRAEQLVAKPAALGA